jgi:hypothetical protein
MVRVPLAKVCSTTTHFPSWYSVKAKRLPSGAQAGE